MNPIQISTTLPAWWSDLMRWDRPQYYSTIRMADIDGDGQAELVARTGVGILVNHFDPELGQWMPVRFDGSTGLWDPLLDGPGLSDAVGWGDPKYYSTIQLADVDGDKQAELLARGYGGIVSWRFVKESSSWESLPDGPAMSDALGWGHPQYYSTIRFADIDGDHCAELIARGAGGIVAWRFDKGSGKWESLPDGPGMSDAAGWDHPEYYSTIQFADIDGDGCAELLARGAGGIVAWRFDKENGVWQELPAGPAMSDALGWAHPEYYSTIQTADVDGDRRAELLARGAGGIVAWRFDKDSNAWEQLPDGPAMSDALGWNSPEYYSTIQFADVDGDKCAELVARGYGGIVVWRFDRGSNAWESLPDGPALGDEAGWNHPQYYSTIKPADVDGDGQAELIARGAGGVLGWRCDKATHQWNALSAPYLAFSGEQQRAYTLISKELMEDVAGADIRSTYGSKDAPFANYWDQLNGSSMAQAQGDVPQGDWDAVRGRLLEELSAALAAQGLFDQLGTFQNTLFTSDDVNLDAVAGDLKISTDSDDQFAAAMLDMFGNVVWSVSGIGGTAAGVIGGLFASAVGAGASLGIGDPIDGKYVALKNQLNGQFQQMTYAVDNARQAAASDWGVLGAVGQLVTQGIWQWTGGDDEDALRAAWYGYAVGLWQTLAPAVWLVKYGYDKEPSVVMSRHYPMKYTYSTIGVNPNKDDAAYNCVTYWLEKKNTLAWNPIPGQLSELFDAVPGGVTNWTAGKSLGVPVGECLTSQNGWRFETKEHSIY